MSDASQPTIEQDLPRPEAVSLRDFGPENAFLAGSVAATLVTWFTFLPSALIAIAAAVALFRFKRGVIQVLMSCALIGLAVHLLQN
jgi:hypothetical protein